MPGSIRHVLTWLSDPRGPLSLPLIYLPSIAPWLMRCVRAGTPMRFAGQARALRTLLQDGIGTLAPLLREAGAPTRCLALVTCWSIARTPAGKWAGGMAATRRQWHPPGRIRGGGTTPTRSNRWREYRIGVLRAREWPPDQPHRLVASLAAAFQGAGGVPFKAARDRLRGRGSRLFAARTAALASMQSSPHLVAAVGGATRRSRPA
jgi:D-amino-acid dehydrogenase